MDHIEDKPNPKWTAVRAVVTGVKTCAFRSPKPQTPNPGTIGKTYKEILANQKGWIT